MSKLTDAQREALIEERGEPVLTLEFDVFKEDRVSMWTHFKHGEDFAKAKERLILCKNKLEEFLRDENMCPFHETKTHEKPGAGIDGRFKH